VCLGLPFPTGIRALGELSPILIPWMWGVNGLSSVVGSVLAAVLAKLLGFQLVFVTGALFYLLAFLCSSESWTRQLQFSRAAAGAGHNR
jgi:hypothetical protein